MKGKRLAAALLTALLLFTLPGAAFAAPAGTETEKTAVVRHISTTAQFLRFARSCARESYSSGVCFVLETDIDLAGTDFEGVPYFAGEFDGGGHSVSGLALTRAGSRLGLFREIGADASVHDLKVSGSVVPAGSREYIGGLCGVNAGTVKNCEFSGEVRGLESVGALVGLNSGSVSGCRGDARVCGEHYVGGVAGRNAGVLYDCESRGGVNAEAITPEGERSFDLAAFSQDDFTDISDVGGVAGENTGVVRSCRGFGTVGWRYTGYNVGGVVGKNSGFVDDCRFEGAVEGRRDVGGVVGQSIPYAAWELSRGKLEEMEQAVGALSVMLGRASQSAGALGGTLAEQLESMDLLSSQAMSALSQLLDAPAGQTASYLSGITVDPVTGEITLPAGFALGDTTALTAALSGLFAQMETVSGALSGGVGAAAEDWQRISAQMNYIFELLSSIMGELGTGDRISARDLSFDEAYEHDEGAVARCENRGSVRAEQNAGGVVGSVAFELAFDKEDTLSAADYLPTQAEHLLFAVVRGSKNSGEVQSRGDCAGGLVGRMDLGAAVDCVNTGPVRSQNGAYVGGVAGEAGGTVARCTVRCLLSASRYVGGAAGLGADVSDCLAWVHIEGAEEYAGALAGWCEGAVSGNRYVPDGAEGVDGVARIGQADPVTRSEFLSAEGLPAGFESVSLRFYKDGELCRTLSVPFGGALEELPQLEPQGGADWVWDAFDASALYCDMEIGGAYLESVKTLASGEEIPLFLVEGEFYAAQTLEVQPYDAAPEEGEHLGGYTLRVEGYEGELTVRMRTESGAAVCAPNGEGGWRRLESEWDGRYLVFGLKNGGSFAVMAAQPRHAGLVIAAALGAALLALALALRALRRRGEKTSVPAAPAGAETAESTAPDA